ncbi:hypothetical protein KEM48_010058 [Puccinia striiformis f. sp. tritici PST-130]|nr:hypothetical protein KEM48_010058 [Puccinia striiformis f. sp. tritici PST-130]
MQVPPFGRHCDYTLLLLSSISAILATPTPSKQLWLDLNLPAHDDIAGFQSAGTLSNAPMETPIAIATGESTLIAHHLPVTGASKRQRVDHTKKSAGAKPLLQEESGTFYGNPEAQLGEWHGRCNSAKLQIPRVF